VGLGESLRARQGTLCRRAGEWSKVGKLSHTHTTSLLGGNGPGREKAEDVVEAADPKPGKQSARQYHEGAGRRLVGDRRRIEKPECDVAGERQPATRTGRQKPGCAEAELVVGDRRLRHLPGLRGTRDVLLAHVTVFDCGERIQLCLYQCDECLSYSTDISSHVLILSQKQLYICSHMHFSTLDQRSGGCQISVQLVC